MKLSPNSPCPCGSNKKYKKCCQIFHKGAKPKDALTLMKSRYSAYVASEADYIIKTTHPNNPDFKSDKKKWREEIKEFSKSVEFLGLTIVEFEDGDDETFVTFRAKLSTGDMVERSRFSKVDGVWLYESGKYIQN